MDLQVYRVFIFC